LFGLGLQGLALTASGWLHGLKIAAVAVVAQAVWGMSQALCPDRERAAIAIGAALIALTWPTAGGQVLVILAAGLIGLWCLPASELPAPASGVGVRFGRRLAVVSLVLFFALLVMLPILRRTTPSPPLAVFDAFYRAGALVFGGGHVVLPLLQAGVVPPGGGARAGGAVPTLHVRGLPGRSHARAARRVGGRRPRADCDLPARVPAGGGGAAVLGRAAPAAVISVGAPGHQRGGRGAAAGRPLSSGVDGRDRHVRRLRARPGRLRPARGVAPSTVARGGRRGRGRRRDRPPPLTAVHSARGWTATTHRDSRS